MNKETTTGNKTIIKAAIKDFHPQDFYYFDQTTFNENEISRFIAYTQEDEKLILLIKNILNLFSDNLEVLVNVQKDIDKKDNWIKYYCEKKKSDLFKEIDKNKEYIIYDGSNQFCVKDPESGDYFALDDHGVFFIYSQDIKYEEILEVMNFERNKNITIFEKPHSHVILGNSEELLHKLIEDFNLEKV